MYNSEDLDGNKVRGSSTLSSRWSQDHLDLEKKYNYYL